MNAKSNEDETNEGGDEIAENNENAGEEIPVEN